jgi:hypothetical protein
MPSTSPVRVSLMWYISPRMPTPGTGSGMLPMELTTIRDGAGCSVPASLTARPSLTSVAANVRPARRSPSIRQPTGTR